MASQIRVLLLGGHGKVAQLLTPMLLSRSFQVTSVIRDPSQAQTINSLGKSQPGQLDVNVSSLEDVKTEEQAQSIISSANPNYIVFSAGAGGKGGPERTLAIDRDACVAFLKATLATPSVSKFLLVSYLGSREKKAPWWNEDEWTATQDVNNGPLKIYNPAKLAADACLTAVGKKRRDGFSAICLRPGSLSDDGGQNQVSLGKTRARGKVTRANVATTAARLLERQKTSCWLDLLEGDEGVDEAVERCINDRVDCVEGEDVDGMLEKWS